MPGHRRRKSRKGSGSSKASTPPRRSLRLEDAARSAARTTTTEAREVRGSGHVGGSDPTRARESLAPATPTMGSGAQGASLAAALRREDTVTTPVPSLVGTSRSRSPNQTLIPRYAIRITMSTVDEDRRQGILPTYLWNEPLIRDLIQAWIYPTVTEVVAITEVTAYLFFGDRDLGEGLRESQALQVVEALRRDGRWVGRNVKCDAVHMLVEEAIEQLRGYPRPLGDGPPEPNTNENANVRQAHRARRRSRERGGVESDVESEYSDLSYSTVTSRATRDSRTGRKPANAGRLGRINIPKFGDEDSKGVSYRSWRSDVLRYCREEYNSTAVLAEVIASLRGPPGEYIRTLDNVDDIPTLVSVLDDYFGLPTCYDKLMTELHQMKQRDNEEVAAYGLRVATQVNVIKRTCPGRLGTEAQAEATLRDRFYNGIHERLRTRLIFMMKMGANLDYSEMMTLAREEESRIKTVLAERKATERAPGPARPRSTFQYKSTKGSATAQVRKVDVDPELDLLDEDLGLVSPSAGDAEVEEELDVETINANARKAIGQWEGFHGKCYNCHKTGHLARDCPDNPLNQDRGRTPKTQQESEKSPPKSDKQK